MSSAKSAGYDRSFEPMDVFFSVFNLHINKAGERAKAAFIGHFGEALWKEHLEGPDRDGIMVIFEGKPTEYTRWYAEKVQEFVNDGRPLPVAEPRQVVEPPPAPKWSTENHKKFADDLEEMGYEVREYHGRWGYHGPSVSIEAHELQDVLRATDVRVVWDTLGKDGLIVYPDTRERLDAEKDKYDFNRALENLGVNWTENGA